MSSSHSTSHSTVALSTNAQKTLPLTTFRLTVTRGPDSGMAYVSSGDVVVIGSDEQSTMRLSDQTVSRFHCELAVIDGRVRVRDLGSRNGTVIGKASLREAMLSPGAVLQLGNSDVRFEFLDETLHLPLHDAASFGALVGQSISMRRAFKLLATAADSDVSVVLLGETGTGKDAAALAIHDASARRNGPFVVVDCGAIPADLLESELFGHDKGAFTGAHVAREGLFEAADGGTLLLDEIGELPLELQPKLLRLLETRRVRRVGSKKEKTLDVRVMCATNRELRTEVNEKRFRADLFYRVNVLEVVMPPLRQRSDDLPLLVDALLSRIGGSARAQEELRSDAFLTQLRGHSWPGNVRELRNHLERCLALREVLAPEHIVADHEAHDDIDTTVPLKEARERWSRRLEKQYVTAVLQRADGNVTAAARAAGVDRMYLYRLLWRHGLREHGS